MIARMILMTLRIASACAALSLLSGCQHPTRAQYDADWGWNVYGTLTPTIRDVDPEISVEMVDLYADTGTVVVLSGTVSDVCKTMGCWLEIEGDSRAQILVMNKDHAFFVPRNCLGRRVHAVGQIVVQEQSVEMLKHLAMDAHASQAEIDAITQPMTRAVFIADAIILPSGGLEKLVAPLPAETEIAPMPDTSMTPTPAEAPVEVPVEAPVETPPTAPTEPAAIEPLPERGAQH